MAKHTWEIDSDAKLATQKDTGAQVWIDPLANTLLVVHSTEEPPIVIPAWLITVLQQQGRREPPPE